MQNLTLDTIRTDGGTQPRATRDEETIREYALDMLDGATFPPVIVFHDGSAYWLADGFHRLAAAQQIGATAIAADIRQGTQRDAVLYSVSANRDHGLRRTNEDKRRAVETLLHDTEWGKWSNNEIAKRCGVSHTFVNSLRSLETVSSEKTYTTKHGTIATMNTANIGAGRESIPFDPADYADDDDTAADRAALAGITTITDLFRTETPAPAYAPISERDDYNGDTWKTPRTWIQAARQVLGAIDLDPASNDAAQAVIQAERYYTAADNGLIQPWQGRVWCNPPYSMPLIQQFTTKLISAYDAGTVTAALYLVNNCTDTSWFSSLADRFPVMFSRGRISFWYADPEDKTPTRQGQAIFYLGPQVDRFYTVFSALAYAVHDPRSAL